MARYLVRLPYKQPFPLIKTTIQHNTSIGTALRLRYEKPLNLFWQLSIENTFSFYPYYSMDHFSSSAYFNPIVTNDIIMTTNDYMYLAAGYYPNTRTSIHFYASSMVQFDKYLESEDDNDRDFFLNGRLGTNIAYYFSPRLQASLNAGLVSEYQGTADTEGNTSSSVRFNGNFYAGISYKIF